MQRLHLFEWGDQPWLPRRFRRYLTELLREQAGETYRPAGPLLAWWLRRCGCRRVVDLCSGSGGPWQALLPALAAAGVEVEVVLTDRWPAPEGQRSGGLAYHPDPVDALAVSASLSGCRTMFTALHHFRAAEVVGILRAAAEGGVPFAALEFTERTPANAWGMLLSPLRVWRDTLRIRERSAGSLFWTFALPVVPALYAWDGMVSHLRSYHVEELRALAAEAGAPGYLWEAGTLGRTEPLTYLLGIPAAKPETESGNRSGHLARESPR